MQPLVLLLSFSLCFGIDTSPPQWGTVFRQGQIDLGIGVRGPNNGSYIVARFSSENGTLYGLGQLDNQGKGLGRFPSASSEETPSSFQILLSEDDGLFYSWISVRDYLATPGLESLSPEVSGLPFAAQLPDGDFPLGHWIPPDLGILPANGSTTTCHGVDCENGWVLIIRRVGSVQIDLLPMDPNSAFATSEDVEVISGDFANQASNSQRWKWDVNYEAISMNSFTMPDLSRAVPWTFNAKELRRAWGKVDKHRTKGDNSTATPTVTNTPEIITAAMANLPSVPLSDTFILPPSNVNSGAHETVSRVNRTFSAIIEVEGYTLMTAEARVTRVRISIPYWAKQRKYDTNGVLLETKIINGTYKSVSTVLSKISLTEPNAPCDRGFYGWDGTCTQCPPGSTSPPRARTIRDCRCDTEGGYAGTTMCVGCSADTYATASGCVPCPTGCNSPPFSAHCDCTAALNLQASNNMKQSAFTYPGFSAQEKKVVFACLIIIGIILVTLAGGLISLWRKQYYPASSSSSSSAYSSHHHHPYSSAHVHPSSHDDVGPLFFSSPTTSTQPITSSTSSLTTANHHHLHFFGGGDRDKGDRERGRRTPTLLGGSTLTGANDGADDGGTPTITRVRPAFQNNGASQV